MIAIQISDEAYEAIVAGLYGRAARPKIKHEQGGVKLWLDHPTYAMLDRERAPGENWSATVMRVAAEAMKAEALARPQETLKGRRPRKLPR